jgi:hypothetical protein
MPHTTATGKFNTQQADLLYLPEDEGYKYLLVVVDIATRLCDAEPLKSKDAKSVAKAMQKIFKRKILKPPKRLGVDSGSEFTGQFSTTFKKMFDIVTKIAGRHRQQSVVETKNYQIGKILNTRMLAEEINNDQVNKNWVDILPKVIKLINKSYQIEPEKVDVNDPIRVDDFSGKLLPIGQNVRVQLDNPIGYTGNKLNGKFRAGDIRWTPQIHKITDYYLRPNQPPMYQVDNNDKVAYTKYQLQVVNENEITPKSTLQTKYNIKKILKKKKIKNKVYYRVLWEDGSRTDEPRTNLILDIPDLIKEFDTN